MTHRRAPEGHRVLVSAPFGADAPGIVDLLRREGYHADGHLALDEVANRLSDDVGAVLMTEDAIRTPHLEYIEAALDRQPAWSDIPFVVLATRRAGPEHARKGLDERLRPYIGNAVIVERPLSLSSLLSALTATMRSRQKQFDMRDRLRELEASRAAAAASEAELRRVSDALPVLVAFMGTDLRYRFANRAYEDWIPMKAEDVVGKHLVELVGEEGVALRMPAISRALAGEEVFMQLSWPHFDGRRRDAEMRLLPRRDQDGKVDGFHIFVQDVTQQKTTEEALEARVAMRTAELTAEMTRRERAEEALRQRQKMEAVGQLTGGIAHDFNNMLTGVLGSLELIKRKAVTGNYEGLMRYVDTAFSSAERAASLTARLLAFSRRQSLDAKTVDITALLTSFEPLLLRSIREDIALRIAHAPHLPAARVDANQLENAVLNLVVNARDAMPKGGELTIETRAVTFEEADSARPADLAAGGYIVVSVSDNGVGMEPEVLAKVFDPFFTTKPIGQGTGLGLSMVYGFARQSGGQIWVHSTPGSGTTASIYLPQAANDARPQPVPNARNAPAGRGERVLIVEDDLAVRQLMSECLRDLSYEVIEAHDANAAIAVLSSSVPLAIMVSDVGLPGMNGRQLAEVARQHRPALPVLFVTGYAENAAIRAGYLGTNMSMIAKPFRIEELGIKVREMLG